MKRPVKCSLLTISETLIPYRKSHHNPTNWGLFRDKDVRGNSPISSVQTVSGPIHLGCLILIQEGQCSAKFSSNLSQHTCLEDSRNPENLDCIWFRCV